MIKWQSSNTDVFFKAGKVGLKGQRMNIYGSAGVFFEKLRQTTAVVIMSVGKNGYINITQPNPQRSRIFRKLFSLPHIK